MAKAEGRITLRIDETLKEEAEKLYERLGISMSAAIHMFLRKSVAEGGIPFLVNEKKETKLDSDAITKAFRAAVQEEIMEAQLKGIPIAKFNPNTNKAYLEYSDGRQELIEDN